MSEYRIFFSGYTDVMSSSQEEAIEFVSGELNTGGLHAQIQEMVKLDEGGTVT